MLILGNAEEARGLARALLVETKSIYELTRNIDEQLKKLGSSFQDEGYNEYHEVVLQIYQSINTHLEDIQSLQTAINEYANVLEKE